MRILVLVLKINKVWCSFSFLCLKQWSSPKIYLCWAIRKNFWHVYKNYKLIQKWVSQRTYWIILPRQKYPKKYAKQWEHNRYKKGWCNSIDHFHTTKDYETEDDGHDNPIYLQVVQTWAGNRLCDACFIYLGKSFCIKGNKIQMDEIFIMCLQTTKSRKRFSWDKILKES